MIFGQKFENTGHCALASWENVASKRKLNVEQHIKKVISRCKTKAEKGSAILNILAPFILQICFMYPSLFLKCGRKDGPTHKTGNIPL